MPSKGLAFGSFVKAASMWCCPTGSAFSAFTRGDPVNAYTMGGIVTDAGLGVEEFKKLL